MSKQKRLTKEAFSEIYLENYDDMKRFAAKRFFAAGRTDPHQVLDAVQETFRILCEKPESYQNSPSPSGWLYVTLTYVIQNQLRQENRQTKLLAKVQDAWAEEVQPPPGVDLELEGFVSPEELELLKRVYVYKDGLENIAQEMGTTKTALTKRVARIKEKFRKNYRESEKKFAEDRAQTASAGHDKVKGGNKR